MMIHPRFIAQALAWLSGYFWIPCPICHRPFAGFEWRDGDTLWTSDNTGECVCPRCGEIARECNRASPYRLFVLRP